MTEVRADVLTMAEEAVLLHGNGDFAQCATKLKLLQKQLMDIDRYSFSNHLLSHWIITNVCLY